MKNPSSSGSDPDVLVRQVERWGLLELTLSLDNNGLESPLPASHIDRSTWKAVFSRSGRERERFAFQDAQGNMAIRFMPDEEGEWSYAILAMPSEEERQGEAKLRESGNAAEAKPRVVATGRFRCTPPGPGNRGPVRAVSEKDFAYADGTPSYPFGTTCLYGYEEASFETTLASLGSASFNKVRMRVDAACSDSHRLEQAVTRLGAMGIEVELLLGGRPLTPAAVKSLRETVSRFGAFRHVGWALLAEGSGLDPAARSAWLRQVHAYGGEGHLLTVHAGDPFLDFGDPSITHVSLKGRDPSQVSRYAALHGKPVIMDVCGCEGDAPTLEDSLPGEELVNRIWTSLCRGGYAGHGEAFVRGQGGTWHTDGGPLLGEAGPRIAFLRSIMEEAPAGLRYMPEYYDAATIGIDGLYYLQYHGIHQFPYKQLSVPPGRYTVELIDVWGMTVTEVAGEFDGHIHVPLPSRKYQALRIRNQAVPPSELPFRYETAKQPSPYSSRMRNGQNQLPAVANRLEQDDNFIQASERLQPDSAGSDEG